VDVTANRVEAQPEATKPGPPSPQASTTASPNQLTMLMDMMKGLQAEIKKVQQEQADRRAPRSLGERIGYSHFTCLGVRRHETCV